MDNKLLLSQPEIISGNIKVEENRVKIPITRLIVLAILAGMFIAGGAAASSVAMHNVSNVGLSRAIGGTIFPVGLILIVFLGGELFTGDCLLIFGLFEKKYSILSAVKVLVVVWLGNLVGSVIIAALVFFSGQFDFSNRLLGAFTIKVALGKTSTTFVKAFCSGIMCNIFVCCAVLLASAAKDAAGKILAIFFPIFAFVVSGYEHCVANMYYIPAGIMALTNKDYANMAMETYGYTSQQLDTLNIKTFLLNSSLPVTLGNMIGGMVFVGLILYLSHRSKLHEK